MPLVQVVTPPDGSFEAACPGGVGQASAFQVLPEQLLFYGRLFFWKHAIIFTQYTGTSFPNPTDFSRMRSEGFLV